MKTILALFICCSSLVIAKQPNIVLIITDDQGYGDLGCHGNPQIKTPHLDKLHAKSLRLTDYHVSPTCAPTRAALMTSHYANRTGVWHTINGRSMIRKNEITIASILKDNGYATGMFGKWHLGDNYPFRPEDRGFQEVLRHGGGGVGQTPDYWDNSYFDDTYFHNSKPVPAKGFCTDVFFSYAKKFIQANRDKPFFAYISTNAPHGPLHCPEKFSQPYQSLGKKLSLFYGMITNIDHNVGMLHDWMDKEGLLENTIFIFTTDNGTAGGAKIHNANMRGAKGSEYDGGHRVPFLINWPKGKITGGRDVTPLTAHVDILPTLLELCGATLPKSIKPDGKSIVPLLRGESKAWPDRMLMTDSQRIHHPEAWRKSSVMSNRWRLVNGKELYDIKADPSQKSNIAAQHPEVVANMRAFYEKVWNDMKPSFTQDCEIILGNDAHNPSTLTSHDYQNPAGGNSPWNHASIRKASGATDFWAVDVEQAGTYEIKLYRWPPESGQALTAEIPPGKPVPGNTAFRQAHGKALAITAGTIKIAGKSATAQAKPGATHITFKLDLPKGSTQLKANFTIGNGKKIGAYYAVVKKIQ